MKKELLKRGYLVLDISDNINADVDIYIQMKKVGEEDKFSCLIETTLGVDIESVISSFNSLYETEDYKNTNDEEWEEE